MRAAYRPRQGASAKTCEGAWRVQVPVLGVRTVPR